MLHPPPPFYIHPLPFQELDKCRAAESKAHDRMIEASKKQDKLLSKRSMLMEAVVLKQRAIRDLGALPRAELELYRNKSESQLKQKYREVSEGLKKFSGVNKKALDQYRGFDEQRQRLLERMEELNRDSSKIEELVVSLDMQKEAAIMETFSRVSRHFRDVFGELVPGGSGELVTCLRGEDMDDGGTEGAGGAAGGVEEGKRSGAGGRSKGAKKTSGGGSHTSSSFSSSSSSSLTLAGGRAVDAIVEPVSSLVGVQVR